MANRSKKCPNFKRCKNWIYPDSIMCATCNQAKRDEVREEREAVEKEQREKIERERLERAQRLAEGIANSEDQLRDENTELRGKLRTAETALATYRSKSRVEDRLVENILEFIEKNPYRPQLRKPAAIKGKATAHEMLALVSDAHFPEVVDPEAALGIAYDGDVCLHRMARIRDVIIRYKDLRATSYPTQKLTVAVNGDMLSGNIHEELEVTNEEPLTEALVRMAYALFDMGKAFAEEFPAVEFVIMPGNHPRIEKKPRNKNKWNNWEYVMGKFVQGLASASGHAFDVTVRKALIHTHQIFNYRIGISHGDGVKAASFAGIPHYAMKARQDAIQALLKDLGQPQLDLLVYGHFHRLIYDEGQGCSLCINGSIKGGDEYGIATRYSAPRPVQALLTFHPKYGMTDLSRINLEKA